MSVYFVLEDEIGSLAPAADPAIRGPHANRDLAKRAVVECYHPAALGVNIGEIRRLYRQHHYGTHKIVWLQNAEKGSP